MLEAIQLYSFLTNESDKLRRVAAAESDNIRRETTAAFKALTQSVDYLSEKISEQGKQITQLDNKLSEKISEQNVQLTKQITQVDTTVKVVGSLASTLGVGAAVFMYLRSMYTAQ